MSWSKDGAFGNDAQRSGTLSVLVVGAFLFITIVAGTAIADEVDLPAPRDAESFSPDWATTGGLDAALAESDPIAVPAELTDPAAAEELPQRDLDRSEAAQLLTAVFGEVIEQPAGVYDELDVEKFNSDFVAVVEGQDGQPGLLTSTLPLRDENADGVKAPVDLALAYDDGILRPENPLVEVDIPAALDEGISLPEGGITISLADAPTDRAPSNLEGSTAFYPNIAPDSDFIALPTPTGLETSTVLRSADAPTSQRFELTMPSGARLDATSDGGAVVKLGEQTLVRVRPPTAMDAEGDSVAATLEVSGDFLIVHASPRVGDAFPILVDPIYESYSWMNANTATRRPGSTRTGWRAAGTKR